MLDDSCRQLVVWLVNLSALVSGGASRGRFVVKRVDASAIVGDYELVVVRFHGRPNALVGAIWLSAWVSVLQVRACGRCVLHDVGLKLANSIVVWLDAADEKSWVCLSRTTTSDRRLLEFSPRGLSQRLDRRVCKLARQDP